MNETIGLETTNDNTPRPTTSQEKTMTTSTQAATAFAGPNTLRKDAEGLDDLEGLIEQNGGTGEWETRPEDREINRWLFPRFEGAETWGTCSTKGKAHTGVHEETDTCKSFDPDSGGLYMSRDGIGDHDSDVETIAAWLDAPRTIVGAVFLRGEPGTGKTALVEAAVTYADRELTTIVCTPDHTKDSLFLRFVGEGNGDVGRDGSKTPFTLGSLPYAVKHGHTLYLDEFMLLVDGLKPIIYSLADGRRFLPEGNVDGSALEIHPNFRLILSSNPDVRGASLPEPVGSRCAGTTLTIDTSAEMLRDLGIDDSLVAAWETLGNSGLWRPQIRELRVADYWMNVDLAQAISAMIPEHCPESQREQVRDTVMALVGTAPINTDGRLIVK